MEALETDRKKRTAAPAGKVSEVPNAHEPLREDVQEETTQELLYRKCHHAFNASMGPVSPAEGDRSIHQRDQAMVGYGDSMGVAAEIFEDLFRPAERAFAVHNPVLTVEFADEGTKGLRV